MTFIYVGGDAHLRRSECSFSLFWELFPFYVNHIQLRRECLQPHSIDKNEISAVQFLLNNSEFMPICCMHEVKIQHPKHQLIAVFGNIFKI